MKVGITGHTRGIGKWIAEYFEGQGHEVIGINRSSQISLKETKAVFDYFNDCDIFVNNAYSGFTQTQLLYYFFEQWQDTPKRIINNGTNLIFHHRPMISMLHDLYEYKTCKIALAEASRQCNNTKKPCKVTLINPGLSDTDPVKFKTGVPKLVKTDFISLLDFILTSPFDVDEITFRPQL